MNEKEHLMDQITQMLRHREDLNNYCPDTRTKDWYFEEQRRKDWFQNERADEERVIRLVNQVDQLTVQVSRMADAIEAMAKRIVRLQEQVELSRIEDAEFA